MQVSKLLYRSLIAVTLGTVSVGQAVSFVPDYSKAKIAAGRLLALFDRQPNINKPNHSNEGVQPVRTRVGVRCKRIIN